MRRIGAMTGVVIAALLLAACQPPPARMRATSPGPPVTRPILAHVRPHPLSVGTGGGGELPPAALLQGFAGTGPKVVVIGDSLATSATEETRPLLWADHALSWNTVGNTRWADWTGVARSVRAAAPDVVVVELGTNDLWNGWQDTDQVALDRFLRALGAPACTILVGYASGGPVRDIFAQPNPRYEAAEPLGNRALQTAAAVRTAGRAPTIWADWSAQAVGQPFFAVDNVHFNPAGQDAWARWVSDMVHHITSAGTCQLDVEPAPG